MTKKFPQKFLYRIEFKKPIKCLLIGKSYLATGYAEGRYDDFDPAYLIEDKRHSLWVVVKLDSSNKYYKPFYTKEKDLF